MTTPPRGNVESGFFIRPVRRIVNSRIHPRSLLNPKDFQSSLRSSFRSRVGKWRQLHEFCPNMHVMWRIKKFPMMVRGGSDLLTGT